MSLVHPLKRIQVATATFALVALGLIAGAEPLPQTLPETDVVVVPMVETETPSASPSRRAWREQLPAVIVLRRPRAS